MVDTSLQIEGMSCNHCAMSVQKAIESVAGVTDAVVVIGGAKVLYDESKTSRDSIVNAVRNAGYKVTG
jgi:copper chaperone